MGHRSELCLMIEMTRNSKTRFLPLVIFPALMPAILFPALRATHVSGVALGAAAGFCIGLPVVGIVWMVKGKNRLIDER